MEITLIRHPPVLSDPNVCHGQFDFPINNSEVDFYYNYYNSKLNFKDSVIYSSPLKRCRDFAKRFKNDIHLEERLAEYHYGDWEGRPWESINQKELNVWMKDFENVRPPHGENLFEFQTRILSFLKSLPPKSTNILVTHLGVMRVVYAMTNKIKLSEIFDIKVDYGDYFTLNSSFDLMKYEKF